MDILCWCGPEEELVDVEEGGWLERLQRVMWLSEGVGEAVHSEKVESEDPAGHLTPDADMSSPKWRCPFGIIFFYQNSNSVSLNAGRGKETRKRELRENQGKWRMRTLWREKRKLQSTYEEMTLTGTCLRTIRSGRPFPQFLYGLYSPVVEWVIDLFSLAAA